MITKLHEILAVEGDRKARFAKILDETQQVFSNKVNLFTASLKRLKLFAPEEGQSAEEIVEQGAVTTTVAMKLNYMADVIVQYLDVVLQKETANQHAVADLVIGDLTIYAKLPAPFLLGLEAKFARIRKVFEAIPTVPPGTALELDENHEFKGVYKTKHAVKANKTRKVTTPQVLYPATKEHPAQVDKITEDKVIGQFHADFWFGTLTPAKKSELLDRIDRVIESCKICRQKANEQEVINRYIGRQLMDYILGADIIAAGTGKTEETEQ